MPVVAGTVTFAPGAMLISLPAAMDRLLSDDALRERYGKAARERVLKEFSLDTVMKKTRDVLLPQGSEKQPKRR